MARSSITKSPTINRILAVIVIASILTIALIKYFRHTTTNFDTVAQKILVQHVVKYKDLEYFSGAALSVSIPEDKIRNYYAGTMSHDKGSKLVSEQTLFQVGSITKSFTSAMALQLEKENKLALNETIGKYLSAYPKWSNISITDILNMTSGLPNYTNSPLFNTDEYKDPSRVLSNPTLIEYAYPRGDFSPPLKTGYFYTNTGYVLLDMIIEKQTGHTYKTELTERFFKPLHLSNTHYPIPKIDLALKDRMAHGYNFNQYDNPALIGMDLINNNLSWAAAAGGIIASTEDIIKWVQALYIGNTVLDENQKTKLMSIVSVATGKPITKTTDANPEGFGLGVAAKYNPSYPLESMWYYEGSTLGFRAIYIYVPCNQVIIAAAFNSATNSENDHAHNLLLAAYDQVIKSHPALRCH